MTHKCPYPPLCELNPKRLPSIRPNPLNPLLQPPPRNPAVRSGETKPAPAAAAKSSSAAAFRSRPSRRHQEAFSCIDGPRAAWYIGSMSTVDGPPERLEFLQGTLEVLILRSLQTGPNHAYGVTQFLER